MFLNDAADRDVNNTNGCLRAADIYANGAAHGFCVDR